MHDKADSKQKGKRMITKLTPEQKARLSEFKEKWLTIGLKTGPANREVAEQACREAYEVAGLEAPKIILWAQSPLGMLMTAKLVKELAKKGVPPYNDKKGQVWGQVGGQVRDQVRAQVWDQVWDQVWRQVENQVRAQVRTRVWDQVSDQVRNQVRAQVRNQIGGQVWNQVWNQVGGQVWDQVSSLRDERNETRSYGQHDSEWLGFYDFFNEVLKIDICKKLGPLSRLAQETGWHLFYKGVAILSERPLELHRNNEGRLHNSSGPSIKWADGYEMYNLNGVRVSKEIALLSPDEITKDIILKQENADYRREIVRKLTGEQLIKVLDPKVLDEAYGYTLYSIDLGDDRQRPFLKMINPSINTTHVEGIHPSCDTVIKALDFRNGRPGLPITLDGFELFNEYLGDYFQQGDCIFSIESELPKDAVKCNHNIAGEGLIRHIQEGGQLFESNGVRYLVVEKEARVKHPEHKHTALSEGVYKISKVLEYDHFLEESREILD